MISRIKYPAYKQAAECLLPVIQSDDARMEKLFFSSSSLI